MKFYNLDLKQLTSFGVPLNEDAHVEYSNYINAFFLQGFQNWFNSLFTTDDGVLTRDYSRSCTAPYSLAACKYCTDTQLNNFITEAGFPYYSANTHDVNAQFLYDLYKYPYGTNYYLTTITRYVANSEDIVAEPIYDGYAAYTYAIKITGDITGSSNTTSIATRLIENLKILGTAHTKLVGLNLEDTSSEINTYAACLADNVCNSYITDIPTPDSDSTLITYFTTDSYATTITHSNTSISGTYRNTTGYIMTSLPNNYNGTLLYFNTVSMNGIAYPMRGYSTMQTKHVNGTSNNNYIVNERSLQTRVLASTNGLKLAVATNTNFADLGITELQPELMYNNFGLTQQVCSFYTNGYKRYIDMYKFYHDSDKFIMKESELNTNGYYKDKHFWAYLDPTGIRKDHIGQNTSGNPNLYYKKASSGTYYFLYDDAYDYVIDAIYSCDDSSYAPTLGDVSDSHVAQITTDGAGNTIDYSKFTMNYASNHELNIYYEGGTVLNNPVMVKFHIVLKDNYLEGTMDTTGRPRTITSSSTAYYFCMTGLSTYQPGYNALNGSSSVDYGSGFSIVGAYKFYVNTAYMGHFNNVTELQSFLGQTTSTQIPVYADGSNFTATANSSNARVSIKSSTSASQSYVAFMVAKFDELTYFTLTLSSKKFNPKETYEINMASDSRLGFGTSSYGCGAKRYIIDAVNNDTSIAALFSTDYYWDINWSAPKLKFTYNGTNQITVSSIKLHAKWIDD